MNEKSLVWNIAPFQSCSVNKSCISWVDLDCSNLICFNSWREVERSEYDYNFTNICLSFNNFNRKIEWFVNTTSLNLIVKMQTHVLNTSLLYSCISIPQLYTGVIYLYRTNKCKKLHVLNTDKIICNTHVVYHLIVN